MKLNYITLKNFRSYYGEQSLYFTTDESRHVTVIHGANGAGKTSLFMACHWCFYGTESVRRKFGNIGKLENRRALRENNSAETLVEIGFTYRENEYCAKRSTFGDNKTTFLLKSNNPFGLKRKHTEDDASDRIKSIIPEDVSVHFFFDGEQIYNFTKPGNEEEIQNAVRNVLRIEEIDRGRRHLTNIASEYRRELKRNSTGNLKVLLDERENRQSQRDKFCEDIEKKKAEIEASKNLKQDVDDRLKTIASSRELAQERNSIELELQKLKDNKEDSRIEIRALANKGFFPLAKPVIFKCLEIIEKNDIPSRIPTAFLKDLLCQTNCLCGRPIPSESIEYQNIVNLLENTVTSDSEKYAISETENNLKRLLNDEVEKIPMQLKSSLGNAQELESKIQTNEIRLENIKENLGNFDDDEVTQLEAARKGYESDIRDYENKISLTKGRIEEIDRIISQLDEDIKKEESLSTATELLKRSYELTNAASSAMAEIYEMHAANMREQIQEEVQPIFKGLVRNADHFVEITLTENYKLLVIDVSGDDVLPEMSAGQRQILSLSFIGALAKMAVKRMIPNLENEPFPIVMDTPFGRLSKEHRENIVDVFPDIADQLVLFVTDEELYGDARTKLESSIGAEYVLQFTKEDLKNTTTTIKRIP